MIARLLVDDEELDIDTALPEPKSCPLEEGEKSEIRVVQARYHGVVSARVTCYSIGSRSMCPARRLSPSQ